MGVTIHYSFAKSPKYKCQEVIDLVKRMAQEVGFDFIELTETGYGYESVIRNGRTMEVTHRFNEFVADNWTHGRYPEILRDQERNPDAYRTKRFGVIVHPPQTESFEVMFQRDKNGKWFSSSFCKTQPFSKEDPSISVHVHVWIITVLELIQKNIMPVEISDEGDFAPKKIKDSDREYWRKLKAKGYTDYEAYYEKEFKPYQVETLIEAFGENLALIQSLGQMLRNQSFDGVEGMKLQTTTKLGDDQLKSTGMAQGDHFVYTMFEKGKTVMQEVSKTDRKIVIPVEIEDLSE